MFVCSIANSISVHFGRSLYFSDSLKQSKISGYPRIQATRSASGKSDRDFTPINRYLRRRLITVETHYPVGGISEKGKQIEYDNRGKPENTDDDPPRFDLCPKKVNVKAPLHQLKQSVEGPKINVLRPGVVLLKGYLSCHDQVNIVKTCRELGIGDGGFYQPKLRLKLMCLGLDWDPDSRKYSDTRKIDNSKPPGIPDEFNDMAIRAIQDSNAQIQKNGGITIPTILPNICIVNFYTKSGKLGLHQDKDESKESIDKGLPVVSFSIGDSAKFLFGVGRDVFKAEEVILGSGDVLIFGGRGRRIFHGVSGILPDTAPPWLLQTTDMRPGRLNLTFRQF